MVSTKVQALGALSVLSLSRAASADIPEMAQQAFRSATVVPEAQAAAPLQMTFEVVKKDGQLVLHTYARNKTAEVVQVDDDPFVASATLVDTAGRVVSLEPLNSAEMFTRAGPRRHWLAVQPGEKLLVGTTPLQGSTSLEGKIEVKVDVVSPSLESYETPYSGTVVLSVDRS